MKSIAYFIGLKIAEICGGFIVYYLFCLLAWKLFEGEPFWIGGLVIISLVSLPLYLLLR